MAHLSRSVATLRISGHSLVPAEISQTLGCGPTKSQVCGEIFRNPKTGRERIAKTGMWRLEAGDSEPENLDGQVAELLAKLTQDMEVWVSLSKSFEIDLCCGLFMEQSNEGVIISPNTLLELGKRGIELGLDIYGPTQEINGNDPCPCESGKTYQDCCAAR